MGCEEEFRAITPPLQTVEVEGEECRTPKSEEGDQVLKECPAAPRKARPAKRKLRFTENNKNSRDHHHHHHKQLFFKAPPDLASAFLLLTKPAKKIRPPNSTN